jgi:protein gp37
MAGIGTGRKFGYADEAWNVAHGCAPVSAGCQHCWAAGMATRHRNATAKGGKWTGEVVTFPERLAQPLKWREPRVIAVQFMGDLFYERVPFEFIAATFGVMATCPQHRFLVLTKRPERMREFLDWIRVHRTVETAERDARPGFEIEEVRLDESPADRATWNAVSFAEPLLGHRLDFRADKTVLDALQVLPKALQWPLPNVWLGVSAENQRTLEERVAPLLRTPAAVRWLSLEPLLGPVDLLRVAWAKTERAVDILRGGFWHTELGFVNHSDMPGFPRPLTWCVVGGESGRRARPSDIAWFVDIVHQCKGAGVPVHVKQLGANPHESPRSEWPPDLRVQEFPEVSP